MSDSQPSVLIVDDEAQILSIVAFALETEGFKPTTARNAEQAWRLLCEQSFDLAILDVMLPGASGVQLCQRIRATSDIPVLLLTARSEEDARVKGLLAGADDYVTKPFSPRELALRAAGLIRRAGRGPKNTSVIVNSDLVIDPIRRSAHLGGRQLRLSDIELRLLTALAVRAGETVSWQTLLNEVWHTSDRHGGRDMVKTAVYRLRNHIGPQADSLIVSVRGVGYLMPRRHGRPNQN